MKYCYIIWDWNGTLLNDAHVCRSIMNGILESKNLPVMSAAKYQDIFDFPVSRYYEKLGFDYSKDSFEALGTLFIDTYEKQKDSCRLQNNARELLETLHNNEVKQAILSAYHHDALVELLASKNLSHYFDWILGADDHYAHGKEDQGKELIKDINPLDNATVLIGDTVHDYAVAKTIGIDCILVKGGHQSEERLAACGCPLFNDLHEVESWLKD